jgi:general secretion pathway protein N
MRPFTALRRPRGPRRFAATATGWGESTQAEQAWRSSRGAAGRWALAGGLLGLLAGLLAFAPASWLAHAVANATGQALLLADARGTVWNGSATPVLTGGPGSRDAAALPSRLHWQLGWQRWFSLQLRLSQACCMPQPLDVVLRPGFGRFTIVLRPGPDGQARARWPAAWLVGLGTPWNTLQPGGALELASPGFAVEAVQGRWRFDGRAEVSLLDLSSRVSPLDPLGSYRLGLADNPAAAGTAVVQLETIEGALQLSGTGSWGPQGLRFRGEASAQPGDEAALANLLNIIGRRSGARSVITIG